MRLALARRSAIQEVDSVSGLILGHELYIFVPLTLRVVEAYSVHSTIFGYVYPYGHVAS
jgi:hypothetical protein